MRQQAKKRPPRKPTPEQMEAIRRTAPLWWQCPPCKGTGEITHTDPAASEREHLEGLREISVPCPKCRATGLVGVRWECEAGEELCLKLQRGGGHFWNHIHDGHGFGMWIPLAIPDGDF